MRSDKSVVGLQSVVARPKGSWVACIGKTRMYIVPKYLLNFR